MTVRDIIKLWLKAHGCDGLCNTDTDADGGGFLSCACGVDDLAFCAEMLDCVPAKRPEHDDVLIPATIPAASDQYDPAEDVAIMMRHYESAGHDTAETGAWARLARWIDARTDMAIPAKWDKCEKCVRRDGIFCLLAIGRHCIHRAEDYFEARK